jgi:hypothetical protein
MSVTSANYPYTRVAPVGGWGTIIAGIGAVAKPLVPGLISIGTSLGTAWIADKVLGSRPAPVTNVPTVLSDPVNASVQSRHDYTQTLLIGAGVLVFAVMMLSKRR